MTLGAVQLGIDRDWPKPNMSWDTASWHAAKKLYERVEQVNAAE
jgi:hypothetical protein